MQWLIPYLKLYLCRKDGTSVFRNGRANRLFRTRGADEISLEEETERKFGYMLKIIFAGTASYVAYQFFPFMGENLLQHSVKLLQVKDPLFKRMGASRLSRFAIDDGRRMKVAEFGGIDGLLTMLESAKDDRTRKEALKALVSLAHSEEVVDVMYQSNALPIIKSTPESREYADIIIYKSSLIKRFQDLRYDTALHEIDSSD